MLDAVEEQTSELKEDDAAESKEKYDFLLEMCKRIMLYGEFSCDGNDQRVEVCCLLLEIMEHYKTFIDLSVAQEKDK